jgi:DNA polymerase elongation subunit (family B)
MLRISSASKIYPVSHFIPPPGRSLPRIYPKLSLPQAGLYDEFILLLDFNSLYPSIIQEFNICFTTIGRTRGEDVFMQNEQQLLDNIVEAKARDEKSEGILPRVIRRLVDGRRLVKKELKEWTQRDLNASNVLILSVSRRN